MQGGAQDFGAIPAAVWSEAVLADGEWWRLLTAAFVHGGMLHFAVNLMALIALGRETEMYAGKGLLPLVFLLSALGGSVLGVLMPPDVPSVGSSGGLVGVIAFQGILAWRRPHQVPPGFLNTAMINVALLVGIGLVGYAYVDNAAHAGGFLVGGAAGLLLVPSRTARPEWEPGQPVQTAGVVSLVILAAACLWTAFLVISQAG
jgi:membrane associated rhomboid family serine protease